MERRPIDNISPGHWNRYKFAKQYVSGRILDCACGVGYGSDLLGAVGVDIEPEAIATALENFKGEFICGDLMKKPWKGSFDWVVSFETIEHLKNDVGALNIFRRTAKNLICSVPNQNVYPFDADRFVKDRYPHQRHYTPEELNEILRASDWTVVERHTQLEKNSEVAPGTDGKFLVYVCK